MPFLSFPRHRGGRGPHGMGEVLLLSPPTRIPLLLLMVSLSSHVFLVIVLCRKAELSMTKSGALRPFQGLCIVGDLP